MSVTGTRVEQHSGDVPEVTRSEPQASGDSHVSKGKLYEQIRADNPGTHGRARQDVLETTGRSNDPPHRSRLKRD
ncbi:hypothetical protein MPDQ_007232 [Monascus purpureus]|uniref:Uncharacterized protein n=1 Tax=Monascus purpureus TaxID=5098 RepID=A0A507QWU9_MONPU|nr:hypothetical protein MPDQ_007232 [Monascus purpureus]BDD57653.1 hypothetical protein MAP00_003000 [Monascus purpureus]